MTATCDAKTGVWTADAVTPDEGAGGGEVTQVPALLVAQSHDPDVPIGDGAYSTKGCYQTAREHDILLTVPSRCDAKHGLHIGVGQHPASCKTVGYQTVETENRISHHVTGQIQVRVIQNPVRVGDHRQNVTDSTR